MKPKPSLYDLWCSLKDADPALFLTSMMGHDPHIGVRGESEGSIMVATYNRHGVSGLAGPLLNWMVERWPNWSPTPHPPTRHVPRWSASAADPDGDHTVNSVVHYVETSEGLTKALALLAVSLLKGSL